LSASSCRSHSTHTKVSVITPPSMHGQRMLVSRERMSVANQPDERLIPIENDADKVGRDRSTLPGWGRI
jgi:hypothetical protein